MDSVYYTMQDVVLVNDQLSRKDLFEAFKMQLAKDFEQSNFEAGFIRALIFIPRFVPASFPRFVSSRTPWRSLGIRGIKIKDRSLKGNKVREILNLQIKTGS